MLHYHKYINVAANICYHHPMVMCRCNSAEMVQPLSVGHLSNNNNNNKRKYSSLDDDECVHIDSLDHHHHHIDNNQKKQRTTSTTTTQQQQHQPFHHRSSPKLPPQVSSFRMDQCIQLFEYYTQNTNNSQELIMSYNHPFFQLPNHNTTTTTTTIIQPTNYTSTASSGLELMMQHMGIQNMFNIHYFLFMYKLISHKKKQHFTSYSDAVAAVDDSHSQVMMTMKITRNDWMFLMFQNQVDSIEKLCHWVRTQLMHETTMWSMDQVKQFMTFAFQLLVVIKNSSHLVQNQRAATMTKCVDIVVAAHALYCIMRERSVHVDSFCRYLLHQSKHKVMTMDQWKVFIDWSMTIRPDFSNYAQDDAWPSLYDDHVTYMGMMNKTNIC